MLSTLYVHVIVLNTENNYTSHKWYKKIKNKNKKTLLSSMNHSNAKKKKKIEYLTAYLKKCQSYKNNIDLSNLL